MTTTQKALRSHLNLTSEGDEALNEALRSPAALNSQWSDEQIADLGNETGDGNESQTSAWIAKGIALRDAVLAEMEEAAQ